MIVIAITHAEARSVNPPEQFRALSERGAAQVKEAANRLIFHMEKTASSLASGKVFIDRIVSSPQARCVETAVKMADAMRQYTRNSEIYTSAELAEKKGSQLTTEHLCGVLDREKCDAVLLCAHGDLAGALPNPSTFASLHKDGWFIARPALVVFDYEGGGARGINVRLCELLRDGVYWQKPDG